MLTDLSVIERNRNSNVGMSVCVEQQVYQVVVPCVSCTHQWSHSLGGCGVSGVTQELREGCGVICVTREQRVRILVQRSLHTIGYTFVKLLLCKPDCCAQP